MKRILLMAVFCAAVAALGACDYRTDSAMSMAQGFARACPTGLLRTVETEDANARYLVLSCKKGTP